MSNAPHAHHCDLTWGVEYIMPWLSMPGRTAARRAPASMRVKCYIFDFERRLPRVLSMKVYRPTRTTYFKFSNFQTFSKSNVSTVRLNALSTRLPMMENGGAPNARIHSFKCSQAFHNHVLSTTSKAWCDTMEDEYGASLLCRLQRLDGQRQAIHFVARKWQKAPRKGARSHAAKTFGSTGTRTTSIGRTSVNAIH